MPTACSRRAVLQLCMLVANNKCCVAPRALCVCAKACIQKNKSKFRSTAIFSISPHLFFFFFPLSFPFVVQCEALAIGSELDLLFGTVRSITMRTALHLIHIAQHILGPLFMPRGNAQSCNVASNLSTEMRVDGLYCILSSPIPFSLTWPFSIVS